MDQSMIDAASGGALMDKMSAVTRHLIFSMASNTQQFGIRGASQSRMVNEISVVDNLGLENQLPKLTSLVRQLVVAQHQPSAAARVCGICTSLKHPTDMCPTLQENESDYPESVGAISGYQYGKQPYQSRPTDNQQFGKQPFRPRLSSGPYAAQQFRPAPNAPQRPACYQQLTPQSQVPPFHQQQQSRMPVQDNSPSLENLMKQLATSNLEFQQTMSSNNMQFQQNMNVTSAGSSNLLPQTIPNPKGNAMEKNYLNQHRNSCRDQLMPILSWILTYKCFKKTKLSYCRFQPEPSQQRSLTLMKNC
ncbi:hypothetical protein CR513_10703, partial [Mucuna pruriens]